ncbi:MAG TPA: hypothetical protein VH592_11180 [Gemmataceae bacterium]|jgi:hypothetical protein
MNPSDSFQLPPKPRVENITTSKEAIGPEGPSPLEPYFLRSSDVFAAALLATAFLLLSIRPLWYSDVWAHIKFGQWIVQHRQLPQQEPFSPFADREPLILYQWLSQVNMFLVFAAGERLAGGDELHRLAGGVEMLTLLFTLLDFLRCLFLLLAYRRISGSMPLACLGLFLVVVVGLFYGNMQRPQAFGEMLFAALLLALSRSVLSRRALVLIPVGFVLWANLHGSYAVGLVLLGVFFLGRVLAVGRANSWAFTAILNDGQVLRLFLTGLVSTVAIALLNPHGPWLFLHTLRFSQNLNIASIGEWQSMLDYQREIGPMWGYWLLCLAVIATQILSPHLLPPTSLLLFAVFAILPVFQLRMLCWWIVLVPWIVLPEWGALAQRIPLPWLRYRSQPSGAKTLMAAGLFLLALAGSPSVRWLRGGQPRPLDSSLSPGTPWKLAAQLAADPNDKPYYPELADALKRSYPQGRFQGRIFASETQGDYLLWALPSQYPVLAYTHVHLFPPEHWNDCLTVLASDVGWKEILDRDGVNLVVIEAEMRLQLSEAIKADSHWRIVVDETGLQQKIDPRTRLLIAVRKAPLPG